MATAAQAQSITGLPYQLPRDKGIPKVASQYKKSSVATAPGQLNTNGSIQSSGAITEKLMEKPSAQIPSKATSDVLMSANEVGRDASMSTPSGANDQAAAKVGEKINHDGLGKIQRGDDSTANKETQGSHSSTKSKAVAKQRPNAQSSTEEGEITSKPTVPLNRIPVQESTPKPASHKKTPPTRVSTLTNIAPTGPRAKRQVSVSKALEATSALEHGGGQGDAGADAHSSAPWSHGKHGNGLASLSARRGRLDHGDHGDHMTWEAYKAPPPAHHVYARPSGEQRPPSPSPMASRLFGVGDWEVQRFVSRDPDLQDWLHLTGWYHPEYRKHELARLRRREEIERESIELRKEGELEKAQLKGECGEPSSEARLLSNAGARPLLLPPAPPQLTDDVEPAEYRMLGRYTVTAGTKRERGEENNDDDDDDDDDAADGGFSAKYCRTSRNYRGSRAGYHGSHHPHHRGCEVSRQGQDQGRRESGRLSPPRGLPEISPPWSFPKRYPRHGFPSPAGHPLPRDKFDAECATDRHLTRDRPPQRHRPHRSSSPSPRDRGYKSSSLHRPWYGRF